VAWFDILKCGNVFCSYVDYGQLNTGLARRLLLGAVTQLCVGRLDVAHRNGTKRDRDRDRDNDRDKDRDREEGRGTGRGRGTGEWCVLSYRYQH